MISLTHLKTLALAADELEKSRNGERCPSCGFDWVYFRHQYDCRLGASSREYRELVSRHPDVALALIQRVEATEAALAKARMVLSVYAGEWNDDGTPSKWLLNEGGQRARAAIAEIGGENEAS